MDTKLIDARNLLRLARAVLRVMETDERFGNEDVEDLAKLVLRVHGNAEDKETK